ncbi:MAG: DNA cytosine methyltransferase, partial [Eggerthellaceae bacterium]|nr:DNA cytosine methyltransferase [Eggerthellaceae bacterium]
LKDALEGLPEAKPEEICRAPFSSRYMSRNRKRNWDQVSYTIPAMAKQVALHPNSPDMIKIERDIWEFGKEGETRRLSWREAAAIQTFPNNMEFFGDLTSIYKQIGNAVPVKLAEFVAGEVRKVLEERIR